MSSIDGKISCDRCGEYHYERSMVFHGTTAMCIGCDDEVENLDSVSFLDGLSDEELAIQPNAPEDEIFFACDECGAMTAEHMLAPVHTDHMTSSIKADTGMRNCCPLCYSECFEDPRGIPTEYTISYVEVIKHEVKVTAMSRAQAERIILSDKHAIERKTRLPQVISKSITRDGS